ncbi:MAG: nitroreductase/quinone reductase family protein, partial [Chloroflexota bacterium]
MSETFLYLTTIGRVTSNPHKIEIWYVDHADCFYLCAEKRQNADWVKNIMADNTVQFAVAEREQIRRICS